MDALDNLRHRACMRVLGRKAMFHRRRTHRVGLYRVYRKSVAQCEPPCNELPGGLRAEAELFAVQKAIR